MGQEQGKAKKGRRENSPDKAGKNGSDKNNRPSDKPGKNGSDRNERIPDKAEKINAGRYERSSDTSSSSRYNNPERYRTGSRYQDKMATPKGVMTLTTVLAILAVVLVAAYIAVAVFFGGHFYPGTTIYGINCTAKNAAWVKEQVENRIGSYTLTVNERENRSEVINAEMIGLRYEDRGGIEQRLSGQNSVFWPIMMLLRRGMETPVGTIFDESRIDSVIASLGCMQEENQVDPADAYVGETEEGYVVVPEVMGTRLIGQKIKTAVTDALLNGETVISLEESECYENPSVYRDDAALVEDAAARNELLGANITVDFSDRKEIIDTPMIMTFIEEDPEGGYKIEPDRIWEYTYELAHRYDTYGGTRTFHSSIGTVETLYGGDYGWAMDQDATAQMLLDDIRDKKVETVEPVYAFKGLCRDANDIGSTYVEICIKRQEMWCYQDGYLVVDTPVVTGNVSKGYDTPSGGVWAIDGKYTDFILVGEGYRAPVDYWMPFNGNIGIHDMQSRYLFGSTIYLTHGSHGCVNTPLEAVEQIFNIVHVGTPVIVYEGETE